MILHLKNFAEKILLPWKYFKDFSQFFWAFPWFGGRITRLKDSINLFYNQCMPALLCLYQALTKHRTTVHFKKLYTLWSLNATSGNISLIFRIYLLTYWILIFSFLEILTLILSLCSSIALYSPCSYEGLLHIKYWLFNSLL